MDTFAFGVVLLEVYTARRAYERYNKPPLLVCLLFFNLYNKVPAFKSFKFYFLVRYVRTYVFIKLLCKKTRSNKITFNLIFHLKSTDLRLL